MKTVDNLYSIFMLVVSIFLMPCCVVMMYYVGFDIWNKH